jgi:AcrR family transcriptional regulator
MTTARERSEHRSGHAATAARHQELHDRLLAAAEAAIAATGLASLRARSLADSVGCSVGAIYGVFPDLDALVLAVNGRTLDAIDAAMRAAAPGGEPVTHLTRLAEAYLDYAAAHRERWSALFQHALPAGRALPAWFAERQAAAFSRIEGPLKTLVPGLDHAARALLARSLFSAVHGMVALGLDEKVAAMPVPALRAQLRLVVEAVCRGLAPGEA